MRAPPPDVAAYLEATPGPHQQALQRLRLTILAAAPTATERLSYRIPTFFVEGRSVVSIASFRNHCSLFGGYLAAALAREHAGVEVVASTVHFTAQKPLPATLVRRIVRARMAENARRAAATAKGKPAKAKARKGKATRPTKRSR